MCLQIIYLIYMYKEDLALDNLSWLICQIPTNYLETDQISVFNNLRRIDML